MSPRNRASRKTRGTNSRFGPHERDGSTRGARPCLRLADAPAGSGERLVDARGASTAGEDPDLFVAVARDLQREIVCRRWWKRWLESRLAALKRRAHTARDVRLRQRPAR